MEGNRRFKTATTRLKQLKRQKNRVDKKSLKVKKSCSTEDTDESNFILLLKNLSHQNQIENITYQTILII